MVITKFQLTLLEYFKENLFREINKSEIKKKLNITSESMLHTALNELITLNLIELKKYGRNNYYKTTFNLLELGYFGLIDKTRFLKLSENIQKPIKDILELNTKFDFILIIFGSYTKNKQTRTSDLDIALIIDNKKNIESYIERIKLKSLVELDLNLFSKEDFIKMLTNSEFNLGKEIIKSSIILNNNECYYNLIKEAIKNGYKG